LNTEGGFLHAAVFKSPQMIEELREYCMFERDSGSDGNEV
jgi:hypothetical protein